MSDARERRLGGWSWRADARPPAVTSRAAGLAAPGVLTIDPTRFKVRVRSFTFPEHPLPAETKRPAPTEPGRAETEGEAGPRRYTRIRPPADLIKLEDRMYYALQPALETVVGTQELAFPFRPFPYQLEGAAFLYPRAAAVLADEMGLGKTMQAITAVRLLVHAGELRRVLIVCPKPLVSNWRREFQVWAPELPLAVIEGDQARRAWQWRDVEAPVKLANYELLVRDRESCLDEAEPFDLVVLDESQRIKNRSGLTAQTVRSVPRRRSWALTGTPVENRAEDLVGIFEFVAPGRLEADLDPRRMGQVAGDYILRRTKDQVLTELPPKLICDTALELSPAQRESYRLAEEEGVLRLQQLGQEITIQHVFELVLRLKQICNFDPATGESAKFDRLAADLEEVAASGRKALVFSQWVDTLDELQRRLAPLNPLAYHGRIKPAERDGVIERFRSERDSTVLLLSYGAGGVGLNLQFSEYVFLYDRWWNPAVEDQAVNRAHRIGGAGPVTVTRFVSSRTIEERIERILAQKREVFDAIFSDAGPPRSSGLTQAEIFGLFKLSSPPAAAASAAADRRAA